MQRQTRDNHWNTAGGNWKRREQILLMVDGIGRFVTRTLDGCRSVIDGYDFLAGGEQFPGIAALAATQFQNGFARGALRN